jgi:hypothetical protein
MTSNVLKGIIAVLLIVILVFLKQLTDSVERVGAKIPAIKVHTYGDMATIRKSNDRDSIKPFIEEETVFRVKGDVDIANNNLNPVPVEVSH